MGRGPRRWPMRRMSKSALRVAREALAVGRAALPPYGSRFSRHDYTQPQLFALLVLKQFLRTDYRGLVALAAEWRDPGPPLRPPEVARYSKLAPPGRPPVGRAGKSGGSPLAGARGATPPPAPALPGGAG